MEKLNLTLLFIVFALLVVCSILYIEAATLHANNNFLKGRAAYLNADLQHTRSELLKCKQAQIDSLHIE